MGKETLTLIIALQLLYREDVSVAAEYIPFQTETIFNLIHF